MKNKSVPRRALASLAVAGIGLSLTAISGLRAATYSWDPSISGGTSLGGSGTWNTALANWWDGGSDVVWGNTTSDVGVFGGSAGTVTVSTALNAGTLQFLTSGYTFTGSAITLGSGGIDASALSSGTTSIANAIALSAGQSWNIGTGASLLASGIVSGANSLTKTGAGTLTLSAVNTYTGTTTISAGTVSIGANSGLGANAAAVTLDGGTLRTTNTAVLTNTHAFTIGSNGGVINITGTGAGQAGRIIFGTANTLIGSGSLTVSGNGALDGAGGSGVLVLNQANAGYTGPVTLLNGGMIEYANNNSLGAGATVTLGNNGGFNVNSGVTFSNALTVNGTNSVLSFSNGNTGVVSGAITLNNDLTIGLRDWYGTTVRSGSISSTITGAHTITANSGSNHLGTGGTLTLSGFDAKASSADIVLNGASLAINSNSGTAAASVTRANSLTINTGNVTVAGVASQTTNDVFGTLNLGNGSAGNFQGYSTLTITPNAATNAQLTFTNMGARSSGSWIALAGTFGGTPAAGMGNIYFTNGLSGSNLIGAGGTLASGTASVIPWLHDTSGNAIYGYDAAVGVSAVTTVGVDLNSAIAGQNVFDGDGSTLTADKSINSLQAAFSTFNLGSNTLTVDSGVITADNATFNSGTLNFGSAEAQLLVHQARTLTINSAITGSGGLTFVGFSVGAAKGNLILGGANTYTGTTNFFGYGPGAAAQLRLTNSLALQNTTLNHVAGRANALTFGNGGVSGQTAYTFGGLSGNAGLTLANNNTIVQAVALTVGGNGDSTTYSGVMSDGSAAGGSLIKTGTGTLTLSAASTYTGSTTVSAGTLLLSGAGSISNSSVINVAGGATLDVSGVTGGSYTIGGGKTLGGQGTIAGNMIIAGNLAPGNSPGLLTFSNDLTLSGTATMEINNAVTPVRGTDYDGVDVGGLLTYGGTLDLTMTSLITVGTYNLFDFGSFSGNLSSVAFAGGAYAGTFTYDGGNGTWNATDTNGSGQTFSYSVATGDLTVVPEPSGALLLGAGLAVVLTRIRRTRNTR